MPCTPLHARTRTPTHTHTHTYTHKTHARILYNTETHTQINTRTSTHTHMHMHTHYTTRTLGCAKPGLCSCRTKRADRRGKVDLSKAASNKQSSAPCALSDVHSVRPTTHDKAENTGMLPSLGSNLLLARSSLAREVAPPPPPVPYDTK
jgi:hypothetical protein